MRLSLSVSILGGTAALALSLVQVQAQNTNPNPIPVPAPLATDKVNILYSNDGNGEVASEDVPFNTCYPSEAAFAKYSYLTFAPKNATINFYSDSNCHDFTFGLDGYYGGYPGQARSFQWVGWSEDSLGELFNKGPIPSQAGTTPVEQPAGGGANPGKGDSTVPAPDNGKKEEEGSGSSNSTFFGGVFGSLVVLSIGGIIFWKTAGKKLVEDKGKGVLPYNRVGRDGDILLTTNNRSHNSFEIGDEEDEEDEDEEDHHRQQQRSGRQDRYHDDDQA